MTFREVFDSEKENIGKIILYREGLFWKAYERSAYHFVSYVNSYKVSRKHVKSLADDVVSVGFPTSVLEAHKGKFEIESEEYGRVIIITGKQIDDAAFTAWKAAVPMAVGTPVAAAPVVQNGSAGVAASPFIPSNGLLKGALDIIEEIRQFQIENKTPMECMMWAADLKKAVRNI